jgi:lysosomal acid lipase/cholesteryl ester hydrolase
VTADPDISKTFKQIVDENGFNYEEHLVTTSDGYVLTMFRINGLKSGGIAPRGKKVVYFQHGILDSADCWISHRADVAPAFQVARAGYDVWLGNSRGNKYSKRHQGSISNYDMWNYDFEEMGDLDITAEIDYALKVSGEKKVAYIGHSQGTTQMYYGLSHNEQFFVDRVSVFIALGPVMQLTHCKSSLINFFATFESLIVDTCSTLGIYEFFSANWVTTGAMRLLCGTIPQLCNFGLYLITDEDPTLNDAGRTPVYLGHFPSGTSLRSLDHYG